MRKEPLYTPLVGYEYKGAIAESVDVYYDKQTDEIIIVRKDGARPLRMEVAKAKVSNSPEVKHAYNVYMGTYKGMSEEEKKVWAKYD